MARMRRAHFKIDGPGVRLNGAHRGRVTIEDAGGRQLVRVRPLRQREDVLPLSTVADLVIWRRAERAGDPRRASATGSSAAMGIGEELMTEGCTSSSAWTDRRGRPRTGAGP